MKTSVIGTRRQAMLFGVLAVLLVFFVVRWSAREEPAGTRAAVVAPSVADRAEVRTGRGARRRVATPRPDEIELLTERHLEPRLRAGAADTGRDLFDPRDPTPVPPPPPTPAPPPPPGPGHPAFIGALPPPPPPPTMTPPEPQFRLIGIWGPKERPIAVLVSGENIFNVREGETVLGSWVIRKVGYESIDVGFVGFPVSQVRRLPISQ